MTLDAGVLRYSLIKKVMLGQVTQQINDSYETVLLVRAIEQSGNNTALAREYITQGLFQWFSCF
jgi:hypothetical protein